MANSKITTTESPIQEKYNNFLDLLSNPESIDYSYIIYQGYNIPASEIVRQLKLPYNNETRKYDTRNLTPDKFWQIVLVIVREMANSTTTTTTTTITESPIQEEYNNFLDLISNPESIDYSYIIYQGYNIPASEIVRQLKLPYNNETRKYDTRNLTPDKFWQIVLVIVREMSNSTTTTTTESPIQEEYNNFLNLISNPESIDFSYIIYQGYNIPASEIVRQLKLPYNNETRKYDTRNLTPDKFWQILLVIVREMANSTITTTTTTESPVQEEYNNFLDLISNPESIDYSYIIYQGYNIPASEIVRQLKLPYNNETGKYDTRNLTPDKFWQILLVIVREMANSTTTTTTTKSPIQEEYNNFLNLISNPESIDYSYIIYQGYNIPASEVVRQLKLPYNNETRKYDTRNLTPDKFWQILLVIVREMANSTTATTTTESPIQEEYNNFLDLISNPESIDYSYIIYQGYNIPASEVVRQLKLPYNNETRKYDTRNLTPDKFWQILLVIVREMANSTTTTTTTTSTESPGQSQYVLQYFRNVLSTSSNINNTDLVFNGHDIPLYSIVKKLNLPYDPVSGKYDTSDLTQEELLKVIMVFIGEMTNNVTTQPPDQSQYVLEYFRNILSTSSNINNTDLVFNGHDIPLYSIVKTLNLPYDPVSGKYDTSDLTQEELLKVIMDIIDEMTNNVTTQPPDQSQYVLQYFRNILSTSSNINNTDLVFNGHDIPLYSIVKTLNLPYDPVSGKYDTSDLTQEELLKVIMDIIDEMTNNVTTQPPDQSQYVLQYFRNILSTSSNINNTDLVFNGHDIPLYSIVKTLNLPYDPVSGKYDTSDLTQEELLKVIMDIIDEMTNNVTTQPPDQSQYVLQYFRNILSTSSNINNTDLVFNGHDIPLYSIVKTLNLPYDPVSGKYDTSDLTQEELLKVIMDIIDEMTNNVTTQPPDQSQYVLQYFRNILSTSSNINNTDLVFNGHDIPLYSIVKTLNLPYDPVSGKYDTSDLTQEELLKVIMDIIDEMTNNVTTQPPDQSQYVLQYFRNILSTSSNINNTDLVFNGHDIPLYSIVKTLNLPYDPVSGKYDTSDLTQEELLKVIMDIIDEMTNNVTTQPPDQSQYVLQYFRNILSTSSNINNTDLVFNGHDIPLYSIVKTLNLPYDPVSGKYDTSDLTQEELLNALKSYVDGMSGITTESSM
ncbi:uncharacterized protein [Periplaneta americana]|uniref:uncharacterized protein n=1 Tax=Periplaneta americana TaxID=6978 RepID=UPI0037E9A7F7